MSILDDLRRRGLVPVVLGELLGVQLDESRTRAVRCLDPDAHRNGDKHPSAIAKPRAGRVDCQVCGGSWGLLDVGVVRGIGGSRADVAAELERRFVGGAQKAVSPRPAPEPEPRDWRARVHDARRWWARSRACKPEEANAAAVAVSLAPDPFTRAWGGIEGEAGSVSFVLPVFDVTGHVCGVKLRRDPPFGRGRRTTRTKLAKGSRAGLINLCRLIERGGVADPLVVIAEGESDALALQDAADRDADADVAVLSPSHGAGQSLADIAPVVQGRRVVVCYDVDDAGRRGAEQAARDLAHHARAVHVLDLPLSPEDAANTATNDLRHWLSTEGSIGRFLGLTVGLEPDRAALGGAA